MYQKGAAACGLAPDAKPQAAEYPDQRPTLPMKAPPVKPGKATKLARSCPVSASKTVTLDDSPGPGTTAMSSRPSRLVSTDATRTPPLKPGRVKKLESRAPVLPSKTRTFPPGAPGPA